MRRKFYYSIITILRMSDVCCVVDLFVLNFWCTGSVLVCVCVLVIVSPTFTHTNTVSAQTQTTYEHEQPENRFYKCYL